VTSVGHDLIAAYELFDRDDRVRAVVLTADPTAAAFCSGVRLVCPLPIIALEVTSNLSPLPQADLSQGWDKIFNEDDEYQGRHSEFLFADDYCTIYNTLKTSLPP
jgi:hypothetical protein